METTRTELVASSLWAMGSGTHRQVRSKAKRAWAVCGIDHVFVAGVTAVVGPNGSGKTTLLRLLATIRAPARGEVVFEGRRVDTGGVSSADIRRYRACLGYLPQSFGLYPGMSSRQFVRYIGELKAVDPRELDERVDRALVMCGLDPACNRTLSRRSEGERRRTGLAAAVVAWPRVAILDEPMRSSDPIERLRCKGLLRALADAGAVCIVASSAISDVDGLCDRLLVLDGGRLAFAGVPHELTAMAQGCVFTAEFPSAAACGHQPPTGTVDTVIASASRRPGGTMRVRAVTPPGWTPSPEWVPARPSLEEAYLWLRTFGASSSYRD